MKTVLYLGTDPTQFVQHGQFNGHLIHYPVIDIVSKSLEEPQLKMAYDDLSHYTHLILTSKNAVHVFAEHLKELQLSLQESLSNKILIAIGSITAARFKTYGVSCNYVAQQESQEGLISLLKQLDMEDAYVFLPRSALSRPVLTQYLREREIRFQACDLYDTKIIRRSPIPNLEQVDEIVFTSPSTVKGFLEIFGPLPRDKKLLAIGPVTEQALRNSLSRI